MQVRQSEKQVLERIRQKRQEMIRLGKKYGLGSDATIACSQELDSLLNEYYHLFQRKPQAHLKNPQPKQMFIILGRSRDAQTAMKKHKIPANAD